MHMSENPRVSILTPVYNAAAYLPDLVRSVAEQHGSCEIEHIVIDDGSTDDSLRVLRSLAHPGLKVHSRENRGQYATHNELLHMARGEFVLFIAADDWLDSPQVIAALLDTQQRKDWDVVAGRVRIVDSRSGGVPFVQFPGPRGGTALTPFVSVLHHCGMLVRHQLLVDRNITFRDEFGHVTDWQWVSELRAASSRWGYTRKVVASKRVHDGQLSRVQGDAMTQARHRALTVRRVSTRVNDAVRWALGTVNRVLLFGNHLRKRGPRAAILTARSYLTRRSGRRATR